jgi:hypothetical protein
MFKGEGEDGLRVFGVGDLNRGREKPAVRYTADEVPPMDKGAGFDPQADVIGSHMKSPASALRQELRLSHPARLEIIDALPIVPDVRCSRRSTKDTRGSQRHSVRSDGA